MKPATLVLPALASCVALVASPAPAAEAGEDGLIPGPEERQLPRAMRAPSDVVPRIRVGREGGDIAGADGRAIQAAVDYIGGLGGGTVEIGPGEFVLRDSLHLHPGVTVKGTKGRTVLRKAPAASSPLALDGDFGEEQVTVADAGGFEPGDGIAIWDDGAGGFHVTVARIIGRSGRRLAIDRPLLADCMVARNARAATVFPVVSGSGAEGSRIEDLTIEGSRETNPPLNGCRGAGIYLFRSHGASIRGCAVRGYNGDGISFQQSNDVAVEDCLAEGNAGLGLHPGSGSGRPAVRRCLARGNGEDGLFLCWRVRHGVFEENRLEGNGRFGISIGHKDSDNILRKNTIRGNKESGVFFRNETAGMAAHRNVLEDNVIEDNGGEGIRIRGETRDLVFRRNRIADTRPAGSRTQTTGIRIEEKVGGLVLEDNRIEAERQVDDRRGGSALPGGASVDSRQSTVDSTDGRTDESS